MELSAARDAREKTSPLGHDLLVGNVSDEDESTLERGSEGKHEEEDGGGSVIGDDIHEETKQPRATNRGQNGEVHPQLGGRLLLLRLGLRKSLVNFPSNKEEEDNVDVENNKTGEEKGSETSSLGLNPAELVINISVITSSNHTNKAEQRNTPGKQVVEFFVTLDLLVSLDNHLVKVESNNTTPAEVGNKEVVRDGGTTLTEGALDDIVRKSYHKEQKGEDDSYTLVHNQPNGIGPQLGKDDKSQQGQDTTHNRNGQEDISQDVDDIIHAVRGLRHFDKRLSTTTTTTLTTTNTQTPETKRDPPTPEATKNQRN